MAFILSTFPGIGKRNFCNEFRDEFKISDIAIRHSTETAIEKIQSVRSDSEVILTSTSLELLNAMVDRSFAFMIIYPNRNLKDLYLDRYKESGRSEKFIDHMNKSWGSTIKELEQFKNNQCYHVPLTEDDYLVGTIHPSALPDFLIN